MRSPALVLVVAAAVTGAAAGGLAIALTLLLHAVQHLSFGYGGGPFFDGVTKASGARRVLALTAGGVVAGTGWWALRKTNQWMALDAAISGKPLNVRAAFAGAVLQIVTVALGAPLGREGAPREAGGAVGGWLSARLRLVTEQRNLLVAAGAGAGLAAVYNVPVGATLFTVEVLLRSRKPRDLMVAAIASGTATALSFLGLPDAPTYATPHLHVTLSLVVFTLLAGPPLGVFAATIARTNRRARAKRPRHDLTAPVVVMALVGVASIGMPQLLGNGKGPVALTLDHQLGLGMVALLLVARPIATAACLRAGIVGGLLTPALANGALAGALLGAAWGQLWPGTAAGAFVLVAAGAVLAAVQRAPLSALALSVEFTHAGGGFLLPLALAALGASLVARPLTARSQRERS